MLKTQVWKLVLAMLSFSEVFPTCHDAFEEFVKRRDGPSKPADGRYIIDPDQYGGENVFEVTCLFPFKTVVEPISKYSTVYWWAM